MKKSIKIGRFFVIPYESFSNYINLPAHCVERITKLKMTDTYFFELRKQTEEKIYVGVREFTAPESCIEAPSWIAELLSTDYVNITLIKNIPKGEYIKLEPQSEDFFDLPDNDKLVEHELSKYCLLELNQIIPMKIFDKIYEFKVIEIKDNTIIDIINVDLNVDFHNKFLKSYKETKELFQETEELIKETETTVKDDEPMINNIEPIKEPVEKVDIDKLRQARLKRFGPV